MSVWVQVVLAAQVCECSCLSERDVCIVDSESEGGRLRLISVGSMVWEFICTKFSVGEVQFEDGGKGCYEVSLL